MNATRQAVHILVKDIRGHALEIGLVLALNVALALTLTVTWAEVQNPQRSPDSGVVLIGDATQILLVVACVVLIGRVVQSDGVAGKAPYSLTRPCSRPALLTAKLAFVLVFLHVPNFLAQLAIVTGSGVPLSLPQLLGNQAGFAVGVSLPLIAVAALTTTFNRFVLGVLIVATLSLPVIETAGALAIFVLIAGVALACQYRWRSTPLVAVWSLVALSLLGLAMLPPATPIFLRVGLPSFPPPQTIASTIRLGDASERGDLRVPPPFVSLPIDAQITSDASVRRYEVEAHAADGREIELVRPGTRLSFTPQNDLWLDLQLSPADYDALRDGLMSVRLVVDIRIFETRETEPIPMDGSFVIVDGRAQCGLANPYAILCRTSTGRSSWSIDRSSNEAQLWWRPMWWRFALNPIQTSGFSQSPLFPTPPPPGTSVATIVRETVSYTRQDVTFENIRLGDWAQ